MDQELKVKWIEALRSDNYKQGTGQLYRTSDKKHCCLGVLCEVSGIPRVDDLAWVSRDAPSAGYLPFDPRFPDRDAQNVLVNMNDTDHKTFTEIADWVEANL